MLHLLHHLIFDPLSAYDHFVIALPFLVIGVAILLANSLHSLLSGKGKD